MAQAAQKEELRCLFVECTKMDVRVNNMMSRARPGLFLTFEFTHWLPNLIPLPFPFRALKGSKPKAKAKAKASSSKPEGTKRRGVAETEAEGDAPKDANAGGQKPKSKNPPKRPKKAVPTK